MTDKKGHAREGMKERTGKRGQETEEMKGGQEGEDRKERTGKRGQKGEDKYFRRVKAVLDTGQVREGR